LLDRTVARVANLPVLLVVTVRPELQPTWVGQPHVTMLPLSRLGRRDSAGIRDPPEHAHGHSASCTSVCLNE
jgi:hypothetical protein